MMGEKNNLLRRVACCLLLLLPLVSACGGQQESQISNEPEQHSVPGSNESLEELTCFEKMTLKIPASIVGSGNIKLGNSLGIISFENADGTVNMVIRKKDAAPFELLKNTHESMATSFYNGVVHRSEIITSNNLQVYVFEMTGYWNGSQAEESWMKIFANEGDHLYQCLFRYPATERLNTQDLRHKMLQSFKIE